MIASSRLRALLPAALLLLLAACASATKRLEQGREAEAAGEYHTAVSRYIQAVKKDPGLAEARASLLEAWAAAAAQGMAFTRSSLRDGEALAAADEVRALDGLVRDAREAGVELPPAEGWGTLRREALDAAISDLMDQGSALRRDGRWRDARNAYRRIIDEMDPLEAQRRASLDAQTEALVEWAEDDFLARRYRAAYERAGEALTVAPELPADLADAADALRERSLAAGLHVLAVFPVEVTEPVRRAALTDLAGALSDRMETEHWRRPPLFVAVAEPARVRQIARRFSPVGSPLQPRRIVEEAGADFGALVELVELHAEERDPRTSRRPARTTTGDTASYRVETGRIRYTLVAEVTLFDAEGARLGSFREEASEDEEFRRARYEGDPATLELGRAERLLFNPGEERRQRTLLQEALLEELSRDVAEAIYRQVVERIP